MSEPTGFVLGEPPPSGFVLGPPPTQGFVLGPPPAEEPDFWESVLPGFIQEGYNRSLHGLARQVIRGEKRFDLSGYDFSTLEDIGATVASFLMPADFLLTVGTGGLASIPAKALAKQTVAQLVKSGIKGQVAKKVAQSGVTRAIQGASVLGVYSGAQSALGQEAEFGEIDLGEVTKATLKGTVAGAIAGGAGGAIAGRFAARADAAAKIAGQAAVKIRPLEKAVEVAGEVVAFGTAVPALEMRLPTAQDYTHAAGVIIGLRSVHATASKGMKVLRQSVAKDIKTEVETRGVPIEEATEVVGQRRLTEVQAQRAVEAPEVPAEAVKPEIRPEEWVPIATVDTRPGALRSFFQRNFTSRGNLPKNVFARKVSKDAIVGAELQQAQFVTRELARTLKKSPVQADVIDSVLKGEASIETLPKPVQAPVKRMRNHIDTLSRRMIEEGIVEGDMVAVIEKNLDVYVTRSYRVFDDPVWSEKVTPEIRNKAKALIRQEYEEMIQKEYSLIKGGTPKEAAIMMEDIGSEAWTYREGRVSGVIEALLFEGKAADSPIALINKGRLGSKDLSILRPRKVIAPEIRALWGEYKDPLVNYTRSVSKMTHLIENQKFLTDVRSEGMGVFFHENPIIISGVEYKALIAVEGSNVMSPLNGLYTTPEIKVAFAEAMEPQNTGALLSAYMKVNGTVKFAKTVGSVMTHIRNVLGNVGFAVANSHFRVQKGAVAFKTVMASLAGDKKLFQEKYLRYQRLGIVHESARAGELMDVIKDARKGDIVDFSELNAVQRAGEKALKVATEIYRAEDDVWKIYAFENEVARYKKALPEMPIEQVESMAAVIVRNTYPTYSLVPHGIKLLRRFPLVGTFVSFPAEVIRTMGNTMSLATREIRSDNPGIRSIGAQRITGMIVAATATAGATATSRFINGMTKQDDKDAREFVPPWSKNSDILWIGEKDGNRLWIDLSYTDPYSYIKAPLQAFLMGDTWEDKIVGAALEAFEPFLGEEILAGAILDATRNTTETGGRVYNPEASWETIALDVIQHVGKAFTPGTISSINRIQKGLRGVVEPYGKTYDPSIEAMATFTGHRINALDVKQALSFKVRDFTNSMRDATRILTRVIKNRGAVSNAQIYQAYRDMEASRGKIFLRMQQTVSAARALGMSEREVYRLLKDNGLSNIMARDVLRGNYRPYKPILSKDVPRERYVLVRRLSINASISARRPAKEEL